MLHCVLHFTPLTSADRKGFLEEEKTFSLYNTQKIFMAKKFQVVILNHPVLMDKSSKPLYQTYIFWRLSIWWDSNGVISWLRCMDWLYTVYAVWTSSKKECVYWAPNMITIHSGAMQVRSVLYHSEGGATLQLSWTTKIVPNINVGPWLRYWSKMYHILDQ